MSLWYVSSRKQQHIFKDVLVIIWIHFNRTYNRFSFFFKRSIQQLNYLNIYFVQYSAKKLEHFKINVSLTLPPLIIQRIWSHRNGIALHVSRFSYNHGTVRHVGRCRISPASTRVNPFKFLQIRIDGHPRADEIQWPMREQLEIRPNHLVGCITITWKKRGMGLQVGMVTKLTGLCLSVSV